MNYYAFYDFKPTKLNPQRARKKFKKRKGRSKYKRIVLSNG